MELQQIGAELWSCLLRGDALRAGAALPRHEVERLFRLLPPALVAEALADPTAADAARDLQDYARYLLTRQLEVLRWLAELDVPVVTMKGMAAAACDWPQPAQRIAGDLDVLVRREDLSRIVAALTARGFRFGGMLRTPWGFLPDGSFVPFYSADRVCNVDLHVEPDSYPLHRGLDAGAVFAAAEPAMCQNLPLRVPRAEHALLIAVSNLAKDKFAVSDARKVIDMARILRRPARFDWQEVEARGRRAQLGLALHTALALAVALGLPDDLVPQRWRVPPAGWRGAAWRRLLAAWRRFDETPAGLALQLQREWLLCVGPTAALRLAGRRLRGLLRPRSGLPVVAPAPSSTP